MTPKPQTTKRKLHEWEGSRIVKLAFIKWQNQQSERQPMEWQKIFVIPVSKKGLIGVPVVVEWEQQGLCSTSMQVERFHACPVQWVKGSGFTQLRHRWKSGLDLIPGWGNPYASSHPKKERKKRDRRLISRIYQNDYNYVELYLFSRGQGDITLSSFIFGK